MGQIVLKPYRTAAECIDWSIPCPSIFDRKKPLAEKTMRRIAMGLKRYVLENPKPFIVPVTHVGDRRNHSIDEPMPVVTGANRGEMAIVTPYVAQLAHGDGSGATARWGIGSAPATDPIGTVHAGGNNHAVVTPILIGCGGPEYSAKPASFNAPIGTIQTESRRALIAPTLIQTGYGEAPGQVPRTLDINEPLGTVVASQKHALISAWLIKYYGTAVGSDATKPFGTVTGQSGGGHFGLVYAFLCKYFGCGIGQTVDIPAHTVTSKDRFSLVTVTIDGQLFAIADIGMRMLTPRELARAQGFPDSYVLTGTKTNQVHKIGNSVCPPIAAALVRENYSDAASAAVA